LEAVLASPPFARSARLSRLLTYLCTKYFAGEADQIKEYSIGVEVLQRPPSFDPATDAGARVEVHRLRRRLQKYYEAEGASRKLRIEIPVGHYVPAFVPNLRVSASSPPAPPTLEECPDHPSEVPLGLVADILAREPKAGPRQPRVPRTLPIAVGLALVVAGAVLLAQLSRKTVHGGTASTRDTPAAAARLAVYGPFAAGAVLPGSAVRLVCGHPVAYTDRSGQIWAADRYYEGGTPFDSPRQYVARAFDPKLFQSGRSGNFSYHIPLAKGVYELHLGFVETTYGPATAAGGGEYSRTFDVKANGRPLLTEFDIYSDGNGTNVADLRAFKDISPSPDGFLHLEFRGQRGPALINFIEVAPAQPHRLNPIRMVAQENFLTEASGIVWSPDTSVTGGQLAGHSVQVAGTEEPDVYGREQYGHFEYALPVDAGTYSLSLHFAEEYFGPGNPGGGGIGSRLFDVFCNGVALLRNFDVFREAGMNRALVKTFHGLTPNAQGKLVVSFLPVHNYASLYALEVLDESQ
jgi:hypothetical protein